ncbi:MAG: cation diffusion facilitator family transporter [Candidatus Omnitrophica bacterium]|nr:cation diffusion facilitator family transporter [Candidatus Omnitrophota bacterium]
MARNEEKETVIDKEHCLACSKKILLWTVVGNVFLAAIKLLGGIYASSSALMADGLQSISCVATSIIIMVTFAFSRRGKNEKFPFGYSKLEFIVALAAFSVLIGMGLFISLTNLIAILRRDFTRPDIIALPVAAASAFLTYMIYRYNFCAGTKLDSPGMIANGCHAGADLFSSGAVMFGIVLAQFGTSLLACDKIAAFLVGVVIVKDSLSHWVGNLEVLLDRTPREGITADIRKILMRDFKPAQFGDIRYKRVGKDLWVGISVKVPETGTVREALLSMDGMKARLAATLPAINEVELFIDAD